MNSMKETLMGNVLKFQTLMIIYHLADQDNLVLVQGLCAFYSGKQFVTKQ